MKPWWVKGWIIPPKQSADFVYHMEQVLFGEPTCQVLFERVYATSKVKMKAYVAVQKRLLLMVYALWRKGCAYEAEYVSNLAKAVKKIVPTSMDFSHQLPHDFFVLHHA